jgi:hypothetical protein
LWSFFLTLASAISPRRCSQINARLQKATGIIFPLIKHNGGAVFGAAIINIAIPLYINSISTMLKPVFNVPEWGVVKGKIDALAALFCGNQKPAFLIGY